MANALSKLEIDILDACGVAEGEQVPPPVASIITDVHNMHALLLSAARNVVRYYAATQPGRVCLIENRSPCGGLRHWGGSEACPLCHARAVIAAEYPLEAHGLTYSDALIDAINMQLVILDLDPLDDEQIDCLRNGEHGETDAVEERDAMCCDLRDRCGLDWSRVAAMVSA